MSQLPPILRSRRLPYSRPIALLLAFALRLPAFGAETAPTSSPVAKPAEIGVLLLPPTDTEPWAANVLMQRQDVVRRRLQHDFLERGFKMYNEALAQAAADMSPKIDLAAPSERTAENLERLAKRTGAKWVVSLDVHEVADDPSKGDGAKFHCFCRVYLKIWDAVEHAWRANGMFTGHERGLRTSPVWLFMESIDDATRVAVASVLDGYPVVVEMGDVGPVSDYLAAQTKPFVPQPGRPLGGLLLPQ